MNKIFCFGMGFSAQALGQTLRDAGWTVAGTARAADKIADLAARGFEAHGFGEGHLLSPRALSDVTHLLLSIPPGEAGDPVLATAGLFDQARKLRWIGYLSTTGVYGDHGGAWVDETTKVAPQAARSRRRAEAEAQWLSFGAARGVTTQIFRLAGIYGPGRNVLEEIRAGRAQCIENPGHLFSRIHVADIANVLAAAIAAPGGHAIFNVCDDEPAASAEVVRHGCQLLGVAPPPAIAFEQAVLSEMARSFWADNKRVRNDRIKTALGVKLIYPSYREGLAALLATSAWAEPCSYGDASVPRAPEPSSR